MIWRRKKSRFPEEMATRKASAEAKEAMRGSLEVQVGLDGQKFWRKACII
jgi:hypothetical protein